MSRARKPKGPFVYLIETNPMYERSSLMEAHLDGELAKERLKLGNEYQEQKPKAPDLNDPDRLWTRYYKADKRWNKNHPFGEAAEGNYDSFILVTVPLASTRRAQLLE